MPKTYGVFFITMDTTTGSNPLWHACIAPWERDSETGVITLVDCLGYYGLPPAEAYDDWVRALKKKIGLDVVYYGNHGVLRKEEYRYLGMGTGLMAAPFALTKEKFDALIAKCEREMTLQNQAIKEIADANGFIPLKENEFRIYEHEYCSELIYKIELLKAKQQHRESRLKEFSLGSRTCKVGAIDLLTGILSPEDIKELNGYSEVVTRLSGNLQKICLHTTGTLTPFKKPSGEIVYSHNRESKDVKVRCALPPQNIRGLTKEEGKEYKLPYCELGIELAEKLNKLKWIFINSNLEENRNADERWIINEIEKRIASFSMKSAKPQQDVVLEVKQESKEVKQESNQQAPVVEAAPKAKPLSNFTCAGVVAEPVVKEPMPENLKVYMNQLQDLMDNIYKAVNLELKSDTDYKEHQNPCKAAARLPKKEKEKICAIMGKTLLIPDAKVEVGFFGKVYESLPSSEQVSASGKRAYESLPSAAQISASGRSVYEKLPSKEDIAGSFTKMFSRR